jgi:hypothetical protein
MKILQMLAISVFSLFLQQAHAQTDPPSGFQKGTIVLTDGSTHSGYIKDNMRKDAAVIFWNETDKKKKTWPAWELHSVLIGDSKYISVKDDFFKVLCEGELCFLQKMSDASGKAKQYGTETTFSPGTDGNPKDYFIYHSQDKKLTKVSSKNLDEVVTSSFTGCSAAIEQAKAADGDLSKLQTAVEVFNNRNK